MFVGGKPQAVLDAIKKQNPFGRFGDPKDIALAMEAVLAEGGGWFNGANLRINGGSIV
jgi:3-oxoacyl-[acyl-carrier protein] reductase